MPNIAIYEGGRAARMNGVSLITTDDGDGGKVEWVPQSQRQTGTLHVSQNGTYRAEDEGLHSWSKVSVRIAGAPAGLEIPTLPDPITGGEIPTGEIGDIDPVPPAGLEPFDDEDIIDADEAEEILADAGYDLNDLEEGSDNYQDAIEAISDALGTDPDKTKVVDPDKKEDVKKDQPKVEDKGQVMEGTDSETGDKVDVTPSGKKTVEPEPVAIVITKLPYLGPYNDGDRLSFGGIEVRLYSKYEEYEDEHDGMTHIDAEPYKGGRYPDGIIPFGELIFPVKTASCEDDADKYIGGYPSIKSGGFFGNLYNEYLAMWRTYTVSSDNGDDILVGMTYASDYDYVQFCSLGPFTITYFGPDSSVPWSKTSTSVQKAAVISGAAWWQIQATKGKNGQLPHGDQLREALKNGEVTYGQSVPVEWETPSGTKLSTSYTVQVRPKD